MAVVIRQSLEDGEVLETYLPSRTLLRVEREQADRLDEYFESAIANVEEKVLSDELSRHILVRKWWVLGTELKSISKQDFVMQADIDSGDLWKAIWWYLSKSLRPEGTSAQDEKYEIGHKRKDHLSLCYEIAKNPWSAVKWIRRWDDWHQICFRPAISRDRRILRELGQMLGRMSEYPSRSLFRAIVRNLGDRFPTRQLVNTEILDDKTVISAVKKAVRDACQEASISGKQDV